MTTEMSNDKQIDKINMIARFFHSKYTIVVYYCVYKQATIAKKFNKNQLEKKEFKKWYEIRKIAKQLWIA